MATAEPHPMTQSHTYEAYTYRRGYREVQVITRPAPLKQRGANGYAVDSLGNEYRGYPVIPKTTRQTLFQGSPQPPKRVIGWQWSTTFNRWSAYVEQVDGWTGFTYPIGVPNPGLPTP